MREIRVEARSDTGQARISVQLRHEVLGDLIQLGERTGGLILQTKLEAARVTESRNRRRQEELDVRILDMGDTIGIHAHQLCRRLLPLIPRGQVNHTHTEAGTLRLGHQAIAGQGRDRLHLFQRQQSRLHLVQGRFRTLQGSSGRRIYVHIDHTLVLVRDKAGRQHERHAPRGQTEKDQGCVRQHPTVQEPS